MNVYSLDDMVAYIEHNIMYNVLDKDRGQHYSIMVYVYGSMLYYPEKAQDYDIGVVLTGIGLNYTSMIDQCDFTFNGIKCDIKSSSYGQLDMSELIDLSIAYKQGLVSATSASAYYMTKSALEVDLDNKLRVRHDVSKKCSNSFVKAKKKLSVEKDYNRYVSMKSLFHSIRMADFACQYAKRECVYDFKTMNELYDDLCDLYDYHDDGYVLEMINGKYKELYNNTMSRFRLYHPK